MLLIVFSLDPGLLSHGIAQGQSRFFSRFIAMQIKAVLAGKPFRQYLKTPIPPKLSSIET